METNSCHSCGLVPSAPEHKFCEACGERLRAPHEVVVEAKVGENPEVRELRIRLEEAERLAAEAIQNELAVSQLMDDLAASRSRIAELHSDVESEKSKSERIMQQLHEIAPEGRPAEFVDAEIVLEQQLDQADVRRGFGNQLKAVKNFVRREGHSHIEPGHLEPLETVNQRKIFIPLGNRATGWRNRYHRDHSKVDVINDYEYPKLTQEMIEFLERVPQWRWSEDDALFDHAVRLLEKYSLAKGHTNVERDLVTENIELGTIVDNWRIAHSRRQLDADKVQRLGMVQHWGWARW